MANGLDAKDWTVRWGGANGSVACGRYHGRFTASRAGIIKIIWTLDCGLAPGPDYGALSRAAEQAAYWAIGR